MIDFCISPLAARFFEADSELDRFDVLCDAAMRYSPPDNIKKGENRVLSCQTNTWISLGYDGALRLYVESDSLYVKGLCLVLSEIAERCDVSILSKGVGFADECQRRGLITESRRKGLLSVENEIIKYSNNILFGGQNEKSH